MVLIICPQYRILTADIQHGPCVIYFRWVSIGTYGDGEDGTKWKNPIDAEQKKP